MNFRFLKVTVLISQFVLPINAAEPTHDPKINAYLDRLHLNVNTMQNQLVDLDALQQTAFSLIETSEKAKNISARLNVILSHLNKTRELAVQANNNTLDDRRRLAIAQEFTPLNQTVLDFLSSVMNDLTAAPPFISITTVHQLTPLIAMASSSDLLTTDNAAAYQLALDPLKENLESILKEIGQKKTETEIELTLNSITTDLTKNIARTYMGSVRALLDTIEKSLNDE